MIHQLIFAAPRPGMSEKDFQDYWVNVHAVKYASKIPQIKKYLVATRIPFGPEEDDPLFGGAAEIWLKNEKEQIESLQTKEFLEGARLDEPKWAAFWRTVVLNTDAYVIMEGKPLSRDLKGIKSYGFMKRKSGMWLEDFKERCLGSHAQKVLKIPGLRRYLQCHTREGHYFLGEALLDCVIQLWYDDLDSLNQAINSNEYKEVLEDMSAFIEMKYFRTFVAEEHWIIGPEERA